MPWTVDDPPAIATNWTQGEKEKCVAAANAVLADGGSDEDAIYACIAAAGKSESKMTDKLQTIRDTSFRREFNFRVLNRQINEDSRTVDLAFSSEEPVDRWFGREILDHGPGSVRMDRLQSGGAVLVGHDHLDHVGVVDQARIDGDRKGRATIRFSRSDRGQDVFQDVVDGIRQHISVGYRIHDAVLEKTGDDGDVYRVTDWEPYEISLVAVPADATVGVGRTAEQRTGQMPEEIRADDERTEDVPETGAEATVSVDDEATKAAREARDAEDAEIRRLAGEFRRSVPSSSDLAEEVITLGGSVEEFRAKLKAAYFARTPEPVPVTPRQPRIEMRVPMRSKRMLGFPDTQQGREDAYRMGKWARATLFGDQRAMQWCRDYGVRVMTTADFTAGGAVVPEEMAQAIIDLREEYGIARQNCFVHPMDSDSTVIPRRKSGVTAYFVGEETATTASDKSWDQVQLNARELSALTRISRAYAEDAVIDVASDLAGEMAYAFAVKEDACLIDGDGTSTYGGIYGIRPKIIDGNHTKGAIDAASGHDLLADIDADDLLKISGTLPAFPGIMPAWYTSKYGKTIVFDALKAAGGGNTVVTLQGAPQNEWLGDPIRISQSMPKTAAENLNNVVMLFYGDLRMGSVLGDRRGFAVQVLQERYAEFRQIGIIAWERFDIVVHGLGDTSAAGPIVAMVGNT